MQTSSWQEICDQAVADVLDAFECVSSDDALHLEEFRKYGLDGNRECRDAVSHSGDPPRQILGMYQPNAQFNRIVLYIDTIAGCCRAIGQELLHKGFIIGNDERRALATISILKTLYHEQFHHLSDMFRRLIGGTRRTFTQHKEEALAVAWSNLQLEVAITATAWDPAFIKAVMDSWFSGYQAPGYRDWDRYVHSHVFLVEAADHLIGRSGRAYCFQIAQLPLMQAGTNPFVSIVLESSRYRDDMLFASYCMVFRPSGPGLASDRVWVIEQSVGRRERGLHLWGTKRENMEKLYEGYKMRLEDLIGVEVNQGRLPTHWTTSDLVASNAFAGFERSTLRTFPPNMSHSLPGLGLGKGYHVRNSPPVYFRVGRRGRALLFALPKDSSTVNLPVANPTAVPDDTVVEGIVEEEFYIKEQQISVATQFGLNASCVIKELVDLMQSEESWDARLENYVWKGRSFFQNQDDLADLIWRGSVFSRLVKANLEWTERDKGEAIKWACEIFAWGGTRQKQIVTWNKVHSTLKNALAHAIVMPGAPINSGYTKVASFGTAFLEECDSNATPQVINDSRVAASLTSRLDDILDRRGWLPGQIFPGLGTVKAARGGTRPRSVNLNWPNAYQSWVGQFAATQVVRMIRDLLNQGGDYPKMPCREEKESHWTMRGVEAVLFMDGY